MKNAARMPALTLLLAATLLLGACATDQPVVGASGANPQSGAQPANVLPVSDLAIPAGAKLDAESSFIMGTEDRWLGRIVLKTEGSPVQAYNHFFGSMPTFGWTTVTAVQAHTSSLTFLRGERVASIQIESSALGGTKVFITVSPRHMPPQEAAPAPDDRAARKTRQK